MSCCLVVENMEEGMIKIRLKLRDVSKNMLVSEEMFRSHFSSIGIDITDVVDTYIKEHFKVIQDEKN